MKTPAKGGDGTRLVCGFRAKAVIDRDRMKLDIWALRLTQTVMECKEKAGRIASTGNGDQKADRPLDE